MSSSQDLLYERLKVHHLGYNPEDASMRISIKKEDMSIPEKYMECYEPIRCVELDFVEIQNGKPVKASYRIKFQLYRSIENMKYTNECWYDAYHIEFFKISPCRSMMTRCCGDKCRRDFSFEETGVWCQSCRGDIDDEDPDGHQYFIDGCLKDEISFEDLPREAILSIEVEYSPNPLAPSDLENLITASGTWDTMLSPPIPRIREEECGILIKHYQAELFSGSTHSLDETRERIQALEEELETLTKHAEGIRRETRRRLGLIYESPKSLHSVIF